MIEVCLEESVIYNYEVNSDYQANYDLFSSRRIYDFETASRIYDLEIYDFERSMTLKLPDRRLSRPT